MEQSSSTAARECREVSEPADTHLPIRARCLRTESKALSLNLKFQLPVLKLMDTLKGCGLSKAGEKCLDPGAGALVTCEAGHAVVLPTHSSGSVQSS